MLRRNLLHHPEDDPLDNRYTWYPTGFYTRAMDRQIAEAVKIKEEIEEAGRRTDGKKVIIMNGKTEYNRCILLGITRVPDEQDVEQDRLIKVRIKKKKLE